MKHAGFWKLQGLESWVCRLCCNQISNADVKGRLWPKTKFECVQKGSCLHKRSMNSQQTKVTKAFKLYRFLQSCGSFFYLTELPRSSHGDGELPTLSHFEQRIRIFILRPTRTESDVLFWCGLDTTFFLLPIRILPSCFFLFLLTKTSQEIPVQVIKYN